MAIVTVMSTTEETAERAQTSPASNWIPEPPPAPDATTLAGRLNLIRQHMGWSIARAAKECGFPTDSWRNWETDGREPRRLVTVAIAIATRTGCDLDWLVYGPDRKGTALSGRYGQQTVIARIGALTERSTGSGPKHGPVTYRPVRQTHPVGGVARHPFTPTAV